MSINPLLKVSSHQMHVIHVWWGSELKPSVAWSWEAAVYCLRAKVKHFSILLSLVSERNPVYCFFQLGEGGLLQHLLSAVREAGTCTNENSVYLWFMIIRWTNKQSNCGPYPGGWWRECRNGACMWDFGTGELSSLPDDGGNLVRSLHISEDSQTFQGVFASQVSHCSPSNPSLRIRWLLHCKLDSMKEHESSWPYAAHLLNWCWMFCHDS